jgi:transposase
MQARIDAQIGELAAAVARLDAILGVGPVAPQMILAEIDTDMGWLPTPAHLSSWACFAPGVSESAGRKKDNASTGNGNRYLARAVGEAAVSAGRTDTFLGESDPGGVDQAGSVSNRPAKLTQGGSRPSSSVAR